MKEIKVAFLGFGTVGSGAYELLKNNYELIHNRTNLTISVDKIYVRSQEKYANRELMNHSQFTSNLDDILENDDIQIIVEVMGGTGFAYECIKKALEKGKNVVTANKDLIAEKGPELLALAEKMAVDFRYEASVLGGIPIIRPLYDSLGGNKINLMLGIMNGTTNFILTKMSEEGKGYEEVLKEAQSLGFAEADPTSDVEGYDAARKLAILSSIAFNEPFLFEDIDVQGITKISATDIIEADKMGYTIKLIGRAEDKDGSYSMSVYPMLVNKKHPLASVRMAYNAIYVKGDGIGDAMFYGQGAGSLPTGSSIVSDIMEIASNIEREATGRPIQYYKPSKNIYDPGLIEESYYFRLHVANKTGVLAKVAGVLADNDISVRTVSQYIDETNEASLIIITEPCKRCNVLKAMDEMGSLEVVNAVKNYLGLLE